MSDSNIFHFRSGIVVFYAGQLLKHQMHDWTERRGGCKCTFSNDRALPLIRKRLRRAELAVIDASDDPAQASDAFVQSINVLKAEAVAVYTEKSHEDLEFLVRTLGAPLFLGPMASHEWEEYLDHKFPPVIACNFAETATRPGRFGTSGADDDDDSDGNVLFYRPLAG